MPYTKIQWLLVLGVAVLLEVVLIATLIPIAMVLHNQAVRIPLASLVVSFLVTMSFGGYIRSRFITHGLLIGVVATLIYVGLVTLLGGGIPLAISRYGGTLFVLFNVLRLVGTTTAGAVCQKRAAVRASSVPAT